MSDEIEIVNREEVQVKANVGPKKVPFIPRFFRRGFLVANRINKTVLEFLDNETVHELNEIEGHLNKKEALTLFYFTFHIRCKGRIVEIGSFKGKSTAWMAVALRLKNSQDKIAAIDPHINTFDPQVVPVYNEKSSYETFSFNLKRLHLFDYVQPRRDFSSKVAEKWNEKISLLFVDGSHLYEDVLADLVLWEKWVNKDGIIIMHDTDPKGGHPGVIKAINEFRKKNKNLKKILELRNMTVFKKTKA